MLASILILASPTPNERTDDMTANGEGANDAPMRNESGHSEWGFRNSAENRDSISDASVNGVAYPTSGRRRILEGLVTTVNLDGSTNVSPMGPLVNDSMTQFVLRPFQTSTTFQNLRRHGSGVFHVTDDVELLAQAAVGNVDVPIENATDPRRRVLISACRWYQFVVSSTDDTDERTTLECKVIGSARQRDFFGFNRAMHAVVEAAILATRVGVLDPSQIRREFRALRKLVDKTGGDVERRAYTFLAEYIEQQIGHE